MFVSSNKSNNFNVLDSGLFKELVETDARAIGHLTGFTYFDYPVAYPDINGINNTLLPNGGLFARIYTCIGESGTGKTTTMIQIAGSVVDRNQGASLVFIDSEGNCTPERIKNLNCWDDMKYRRSCIYIPPSPPISINRVYDIIRRIAHSKDGKLDKIGLDTPFTDVYTGKFIKVYPPTVVIVDSVPALVISQTMDEQVDGKKDFKSVEQIASNVDGMREAKDNTNFLRKVKGVLDQYNIILILINHTTKEVPMGMFDKPKKFHPNLKAGEKLKGGNEQIYQSFCMYRLTQRTVIDDRNPIYGDNIRGSISSLDYVKNKSNVSSNEYMYVFDKRTGYRPELSDFEYLLSRKFGISGTPFSMYMTILPEIKFTRKNLVDKCQEHPILSRAISFTAKYRMGNDVIVLNRFGELDIERFALMPLVWRYSVLMSTTIPYPRFSLHEIGNENMIPDHLKAFEGNLYTGLNGDYVSPINVDKLKRIVSLYETEHAECTELKNCDPFNLQ